MESRVQHDTLDQIIAKAIRSCGYRYDHDLNHLTLAVRDALLAEGRIQEVRRFDKPFAPHESCLVIPLVGVGCGNAKEDTP